MYLSIQPPTQNQLTVEVTAYQCLLQSSGQITESARGPSTKRRVRKPQYIHTVDNVYSTLKSLIMTFAEVRSLH